MNQRPRCKKCGRPLKSPTSIARGLGPKCAGVTPQGRGVHSKSTRMIRKVFNAVGSGAHQQPMLAGETLTKRQKVRRSREERRRLPALAQVQVFSERKPFHCGVNSRDKTPLVFVPTPGGDWQASHSDRRVSHESLLAYLKQY